jgi:hypothetical protein
MSKMAMLSRLSDSDFFLLVGSGLALAAVLIRHFFRDSPLQKPHQMVLWVGEMPEDDSSGRDSRAGRGEKAAPGNALSKQVS